MRGREVEGRGAVGGGGGGGEVDLGWLGCVDARRCHHGEEGEVPHRDEERGEGKEMKPFCS